jgi:CheY-like chemotaxis protein
MGKSKSILTASGIIDPTVVFDSLQTLGLQRGDHLHFSWAPSHEMHGQLQHWRQMGISLSWETDGRMNMRTAELMNIIFMNETERKMYEHKGVARTSIFISAFPNMTLERQVRQSGAIAYLRKPFKEDQLLEHIDTAARLSNRRLATPAQRVRRSHQMDVHNRESPRQNRPRLPRATHRSQSHAKES